MADSLSTIGSIAQFITSSLNNIPEGVSGNMVQFVDLARQQVAQFTGVSIGSNSIAENYQSVICNLSLATAIDMVVSQGYASLAELTFNGGQVPMSADGYRKMADMQLKVIGRHVNIARSLS
jgi:hypothetical protein